MTQKIAFKTVGCKVNQYETGSLRKAFASNGYRITDFNGKADIYIINTCAVTAEAERKSKQMIRKAARQNPSAIIIVTGCGVESNLQSIKECTDANLIISNYYKDNLFDLFEDYTSSSENRIIYFQSAGGIKKYTEGVFHSNTHRIRGFVKIQDGCNQFCNYCVIPYLRGRSRSRSSKEIISEINNLTAMGHKEIVLLGINLGSYGDDLVEQKMDLSTLIRKIEKIPVIKRIRLSSIELPWINNALIETCKNSLKICHHLHIPLQSGDDKILSLMGRKYSTEQFRQIVHTIRNEMPDIAITTDVIVGFPGEDETSFNRSYRFIEDMAFAKVHVFPYSERSLTLASFFPNKVYSNMIKSRSQKLIHLSKQLRQDFFLNNLGKEKDLLVEYQKQRDSQYDVYGLTDNYIQVRIPNSSLKKGQLAKIRLKRLQGTLIEGETIWHI